MAFEGLGNGEKVAVHVLSLKVRGKFLSSLYVIMLVGVPRCLDGALSGHHLVLLLLLFKAFWLDFHVLATVALSQ